jgi:anti-anti-sigma regulatory factor
MLDFEIGETETAGELAMSGSLTIENIPAIKEGLLAAFRKADHIVLSLDEVAAADLAFLQILCSSCRTAAAAGKTLVLKDARPRLLAETAAAGGYLRKKECSRGKNCLWITEEEE